MVKSHKCIACGTKYSYCPDCSRADALKPTWYNDFCDESCKDLWYTLTRYNMSLITKSEAKSAILELNLKPIESYSQFVQRDYAKVMAEEKKPKRGKRTEIKPIDDAMDVELEIVQSVVNESIEIEQQVVAESAVEAIHEVVKQENE